MSDDDRVRLQVSITRGTMKRLVRIGLWKGYRPHHNMGNFVDHLLQDALDRLQDDEV